jgi:hypothetical protein
MRRYQQAFREAGAVSPDTAVRPSDAGLRESFTFRRLVRRRILVRVRDGRYYLDEARAVAVQQRRQRLLTMLLLVILLVLIGALVVWLL